MAKHSCYLTKRSSMGAGSGFDRVFQAAKANYLSFLVAAIVFIVGLGTVALTLYSAKTRKGAGAYLCHDCRFNDPESCKKVERPHALICTSYRQVGTLVPDEKAQNESYDQP